METEIPQENENEDTADADINWDNRILCSDGNCIGVIGADGCCKECGKRYEGPLAETIAVEEEDQVADEDEEMPAEEAEIKAAGDFPAADDWENRVLCSDGNCIGVIGPDGKCKECGKPME
ncbi:MAG: hypothetical protein JSW26_03435 [Desulfobacterales bacterium]|nr:MAG: hypothetical protein JSW26_03435 [Desulfobacterales bacterium]